MVDVAAMGEMAFLDVEAVLVAREVRQRLAGGAATAAPVAELVKSAQLSDSAIAWPFLESASKPEGTADHPGAMGRCRRSRVDLEVINYVAVHKVILPTRQADLPITSRTLSCFEHI